MRSKIESYDTIAKQLKKDYPKLSDFEILSLSIQIERNQILENGLAVSTSDSCPVGLEAIANALGHGDTPFQVSVAESLKQIVDKK